MPRARKSCSAPTCSNLQPCPTHRRKPWAGSTRRKRLPRGWDKLRRSILKRDPYCMIRELCNGAPSTEVDHVRPGDDHSRANLQGTCSECHKAKTQREARAAR